MLDKIKAYGFMAATLVLAALLLVQIVRLHTEQTQHQALKTTVAQDLAKRTGATLKDEQRTATKERSHGAQTQENSDEFTVTQPVREAIARADLAAAERMRLGAERRSATYHAQAQADAAACRDLADRHAAFDAHIVRGAGVVAGLRADLGRRDAEVKLLRGQIDVDRTLLGED